jgi:hypothetical protein
MDSFPMKANKALGSPLLKSMAFHAPLFTESLQIWWLHFFYLFRKRRTNYLKGQTQRNWESLKIEIPHKLRRWKDPRNDFKKKKKGELFVISQIPRFTLRILPSSPTYVPKTLDTRLEGFLVGFFKMIHIHSTIKGKTYVFCHVVSEFAKSLQKKHNHFWSSEKQSVFGFLCKNII